MTVIVLSPFSPPPLTPPPNFLKYKTIVHIIISYLLISNYQKNFFFLPTFHHPTPQKKKILISMCPLIIASALKKFLDFNSETIKGPLFRTSKFSGGFFDPIIFLL